MERTENLIIKNLLENDQYSKKVSPFVEKDYFSDIVAQTIIDKYANFINKYKKAPTYEEVVREITRDNKIVQGLVEQSIDELEQIKKETSEKFTFEYLVDETERHFQEVALEKGVLKAAEILQDESKRAEKDTIPEMMRNALKISFKNTSGQVYASEKQIADQFDYYHHPERKFPFPEWPTFTGLFKGGVAKKRIHVYVSKTNTGKTIFLVNTALQLIKAGCNVLYVTAEDGENAIIERVDGNVLDIQTDRLPMLKQETYIERLKSMRDASKGKLVIKEYPTSFANVNHIRALLDELEIKEEFKPDFIFVDYINIFNSIRFKNMGDTYILVKAVTEEFRGLAVEKNVGIFSASQLNRGSMASSDVELQDIAESMGIANTGDAVIAIIETDDLKIKGQYLLKLLKSRYSKIDPRTQKFLMCVDKDKQQIWETENPRDGIVTEDVSTDASGNSLKF